jgi:hypothetical protein
MSSVEEKDALFDGSSASEHEMREIKDRTLPEVG